MELNLNYNLFTEIFQKKSKLINGQGIFGLPNLESLEFAGNQLVNLNGIQFFKKLKILVLHGIGVVAGKSIEKNNLTKKKLLLYGSVLLKATFFLYFRIFRCFFLCRSIQAEGKSIVNGMDPYFSML